MTHPLASLHLWVTLMFALSAPSISAQEDSTTTKSAAAGSARTDEVWLVSTRHLCFPSWEDPRTYELDVRRYDSDKGWVDSSVAEFTGLPILPTVIYVHGNRVGWQEASQYGWQVHQVLSLSEHAPAKMRFVIWTWPSDQVKGALRDVRAKADRADNEAYFLGWFLSQQNPAVPMGLLGYSYGARVTSGGLHLLGGGALGGIVLPQPAKSDRLPARVALLAAAEDNGWLCPGNCHGMALESVERMLILYNNCDPALQRYDVVDRCYHASALGYVGIASECLGGYASRVELLDVTSTVGRSHAEDHYFGSSYLRQEICRMLFPPMAASIGGD